MSDLIRREDVIEECVVSFGLTIEDIEKIPAVDAVEISAIKRYIKEQTIKLRFLEPNSEEYIFQDRLITALLIMFNELAYGGQRR